MKLKTMSVTDLNVYIKRNFDHDFILNNLTVMGEISNFKAHSSGHLYFSLKDESAKVNCVMFRSEASGLNIRIIHHGGQFLCIELFFKFFQWESGFQDISQIHA